MSKLALFSHLSHVMTLPAIRSGDAEIPHTIIRPGPNTVADTTIAAWKDHDEVKNLLGFGSIGGLEITAEDGAPLEHEKALEALFEPGQIAPLSERLKRAQAALEAANRYMANASKPADDIKA